jgi:hypothetical protein
VNDRLYVNGEGKPTMSQMLKIQAEVDALKGKPLPGVPMGDVETAISYFAGLSIGLLLIAVVTYYVLNFAFVNRIDGAYTRLLRYALKISWKDKVTNIVVYKDIVPVSSRLRESASSNVCWTLFQSWSICPSTCHGFHSLAL